jgi:hypothetical protein
MSGNDPACKRKVVIMNGSFDGLRSHLMPLRCAAQVKRKPFGNKDVIWDGSPAI